MKLPVVYAILLLFFLIPVASPQEKQNVTVNDFMGTIELKGNAGSLLSLTIPETVYRGLQRPDLGDLRIYDSAGNLAPFVIRPVPGITETLPEQTVPVLAWNENTRRFNAPGIEINTSEAAVIITSQSGYEKDSVYLIDLSGMEANPSKLILDFEKTLFFNAALSIRSSDDLVNWKNYEKTQTAAFYNSPGTDINEFDIPCGRYLLLNFDAKIPAIQSGTVRFDPAETPILEETFFTGTKSDDGKTIRYDTGGCFPAAKIQFTLSSPDSIKVIVRENKETPNAERWQRAGEMVIYHIQSPGKGPSLNGALNIAGFTGPHWEIEAAGEQAFTEIPLMSLMWEKHELVFLARGQGPWILAYGNKNCGPAAPTLSVGEEDIFPAITGEGRFVQQNENNDSGFPWKQILLWGILILIAVALSALAVHIIKSAGSGDQKTNN